MYVRPLYRFNKAFGNLRALGWEQCPLFLVHSDSLFCIILIIICQRKNDATGV